MTLLRRFGEERRQVLTMAPSEHRGLHVDLGVRRGRIRFQAKALPTGFSCELWRSETVFLQGHRKIADPLLSLGDGPAVLEADEGNLYLRLTVGNDVATGRHRLAFDIYAGQVDGGSSTLELIVDVVPIHLPSVDTLTIQGAVWPPEIDKWRADDDPIRVMAFMRDNDFNAVALLRGNGHVADLARVAIEQMGYRTVRLPNFRMLNRHYRPEPAEFAEYLARTETYLKRYEPLFNHPGFRDKLTIKLWDEPKPNNYDLVARTYGHVRRHYPWLPLELSEEPSPGLDDVADIWIVSGRHVHDTSTSYRHAKGQQVWLYANVLHSLGRSDASMRVIGWLLWRYRLSGYYFWGINWAKEDPWKPPAVDEQRPHVLYRRGTVLYPSPACPNKLLNSLRFQAFRNGLQDWRWLAWLDQRAEAEGPDSAEALLASRLRERVNWNLALDDRINLQSLRTKLTTNPIGR